MNASETLTKAQKMMVMTNDRRLNVQQCHSFMFQWVETKTKRFDAFPIERQKPKSQLITQQEAFARRHLRQIGSIDKFKAIEALSLSFVRWVFFPFVFALLFVTITFLVWNLMRLNCWSINRCIYDRSNSNCNTSIVDCQNRSTINLILKHWNWMYGNGTKKDASMRAGARTTKSRAGEETNENVIYGMQIWLVQRENRAYYNTTAPKLCGFKKFWLFY